MSITHNRLDLIYSKIKDKKTISEKELLFCISKTVGIYPTTINQYHRFLIIFGYIEPSDVEGEWVVKKVDKKSKDG
jgi:hypothetical protein